MNKVEIIHEKRGTHIKLNGEELRRITDYQIRKNSALESTELILTIDVSELHETITELCK